MYNGCGKYYNEDNTYYEGGWENGLKHGEGIICKSNGDVIYAGTFYQGEIASIGRKLKNIIDLFK